MTASDRRRRLAGALPDAVDALLVTDLVNVRWASGFGGSLGALLVSRDDAAGPAGGEVGGLLATDDRYRLRAAEESPDLPVLVTRRPAAGLLAEAAQRGIRRLGFETEHVTVAAHQDLTAPAHDLGIDLVPCRHLVERLRPVKDPDEIDALRRACAATDAAFAAVLPLLHAGVTERQVEWWLTQAMRDAGADGPAFDAIVASGANSAIPHHRPGERPIEPGDLVKMDFGAAVDGMHADMTRTVVVGRVAAWQRDLYEQVRGLQEKMRGRTVPGAVPRELDAATAERIAATGHRPAHGLGHGVGLRIHEEPWLTPGSTSDPLVAGVPVTVEPGIYLDGRGGVRIEDTTLVADGGAMPLTTSPRDLLEV